VPVTIRAAHINEGRTWWVVVPFSPAFGECSPEEREKVIDSIADCVDGVRKRRMEGIVLIAWRESDRMHFAGPKNYAGPYPKLSWPELLRRLARQFYCDDPIVMHQLRGEGCA
jgi:hypothetical protein